MSGQPLRSASDGRPALITGPWSREKHDLIRRVATIFSTGMKYRSRFRCYIDLFAGPGRCVIEATSEELDGSPIQALSVPDTFTHYFLNDINSDCISALRERAAAVREFPVPTYYSEDCNAVVPEIRKVLPPAWESLELAVIDAWGWELSFDSLAALTYDRRMDLIITFPVGFMKRNWNRRLSQLDSFLGGDGYREDFLEAMGRGPRNASRILLDYYKDRLSAIGYRYANDQVWLPNTRGVKLYHMVLASKHPRGDRFVQEITKRTVNQFRLSLTDA